MSARQRLRALWARPWAAPDRSRHVYPCAYTIEQVAEWLADVWPFTWGHETLTIRELTAGIWLAKRNDAQQAACQPQKGR